MPTPESLAEQFEAHRAHFARSGLWDARVSERSKRMRSRKAGFDSAHRCERGREPASLADDRRRGVAWTCCGSGRRAGRPRSIVSSMSAGEPHQLVQTGAISTRRNATRGSRRWTFMFVDTPSANRPGWRPPLCDRALGGHCRPRRSKSVRCRRTSCTRAPEARRPERRPAPT
jgi:hypothetical protein